MRTMTLPTLAFTLVTLPLAAVAADPVLPDFAAATFGTGAANPYVSLQPGYRLAMAGQTDDGITERDVIPVMGPGPVILGIATTTIQDDAFADSRLVERTFD